MPRVICDLPNASGEISGVKFHPLEDGRLISDEISQEQAERFASIPGYELDEDEREPVKAPEPPAPKLTKKQQADADKAAKAAAKDAEKASADKAAADKAKDESTPGAAGAETPAAPAAAGAGDTKPAAGTADGKIVEDEVF